MTNTPRSAAELLANLDELEVRIEKLVSGGDGMARHEGVAIFVPRSAPGDLLRVRLVERRPGYGRAELLEILEPGPDRRAAPCPFYDRCGGCDLQHLTEEAQLRLKAQTVAETLRRLGGVDLPPDVTVIAGKSWGYRLRAQLQVAEDTRGNRVGYFARGSHDLVAIDRCPVLTPDLEAMLKVLPRRLRGETHRRIDLAMGDDGQLSCAPKIEGLPHGGVTLKVGEHIYEYDARCFFQAHHELVGSLVEQAIGPWEGEAAVDLYAGVGLFSLPLSRRYQRVTAVEGERIAARYGRRNATRNKVQGLSYEARSVDSWIESLPEGLDRVLVDPPRIGLTAKVRRVLREKRPRRLTYVSCHAATLARDLKILREVFRVERTALLDMFPQTGHMEAVVHLVPKEEGA